jgi:hypothetical protein
MIDLLPHAPVPSTVLPLPHPPPSRHHHGGQARDGNPTQTLVARWLAGTADASPRGLRTPPQDMGGTGLHPAPAPVRGPPEPAGRAEAGHGGSCGGRTASRHSSPLPPRSGDAGAGAGRDSAEAGPIVSYLQIPASINDSRGSLAEFAAQITCLFWFESSFTLHRVEESRTTPLPVTPLVGEAVPSTGFRKWVTTILSTTKVTQNVILLALMFIYRLKKLNPTVKGKAGSEFRLLTVALMLGNKCERTSSPAGGRARPALTCPQFWTTTPTPTRRGPRSRASPSRRSTSWRSSS